MEKDLHLTHHISQRYNQELEDVRGLVMKMGGLVERQLTDGLQALVTMDERLGNKVTDADGPVNDMELDIDKKCIEIIARRQPAASDLRLLVAILKTITDLERIGDEAQRLGQYACQLANENLPTKQFQELRHLGNHVKKTLRSTLNAFARIDTEAATQTIEEAAGIDEEYEAITRQYITHMMEDPRDITVTLRVTWCARALERIGAHATNICEYVIYLAQGKDIRHAEMDDSTSD